MSLLDNQSETAQIVSRTSPAAVVALLVANQTFINIFFGVAIALVTLISVYVQIRNSNRKDERERVQAERDRIQAERDALAHEKRERRAEERHQANLAAVRLAAAMHPDDDIEDSRHD